MKKIFGFLMAAAVLFGAASCAKEDISSSLANGEQVEVTFTANLPELGTRAYGDGNFAKTLRYYVYEQTANGLALLPALSKGVEESDELVTVDQNGKATVRLALVKGMTYTILFWADHNKMYTINPATQTVTIDYIDANDDSRDAFFACEENFKPEHSNGTKSVELSRPFAQLNAATDDIEAVTASGVTLVSSTVTVDAYTSLNLVTGDVVGQANPVTFTAKPLPTETLKAGYTYLSMNYILVNDKMLTTAAFEFKGKRADDSVVTFTNTSYDNVPLQRNYKTNILGSLLTKSTDFNVEIKPAFEDEEDYEVQDIHVATAQELAAAVNAVAATGGEIVLVDDIELSEILSITSTPSTRAANAEGKVIILDGNGQKLISTAGRAINVSGAENVIIKNLTIECSGERAINVIQNAKNVTIENVTATAANYTVNVASSAPNAFVAIKKSILNGLCTVNVAGAGAQVTLDGCTVNCNDNNTTAGEAYSALSLNKDAVGGSIIATNTTVNVAEGSDSTKGRNGAENGTVTINGSTDEVVVMVAAIIYPNNTNYHAFVSLDGAIDFAKAGDTIQLIRDITLTETLEIPAEKNIFLDLNGKTITGTMHKDVGAVIKNAGNLTIKNGTIKSTAENGGSAVLNSGTLVVEEATLNGAVNANGSWPSYTVNNTGVLTINDSKITSYHGSVASYNEGALVTLNNSEIAMTGIPGFTSHGMYTYNNGKIVVNGGTYENKATDQASSGASVINGAVEVNAGTFSGRIENYYGTPVLKGGTYSVKPNKNFVAEGYKVVDNNGVYSVVAGNYYDSAIVDWDGVRYEGEWFESGYMENTLWLNNLVFSGDAAIKVENKTYNAIVIQNCSGSFKNDVITIANNNSSVMILENLNLTIAEGKKLITTANPYHQVFMTNITINGVKMTQESIAQYLENVVWYQVVE